MIFGECELSVGDEPTEHDRVDPPVQTVEAPQAEMVLALTAETGATADLPAVATSQAETDADADDEGEDESDEARAADGSQAPSAGKRRRKRKDAVVEDAAEMRWSHPPSQPPPAN